MLFTAIAVTAVVAPAGYAAWARHREHASRRAWLARQNDKALVNNTVAFERRAKGK
jgi:hypothetical protein